MIHRSHLDLSELEQMAHGDRAFIRRMLQACCESAPQLVVKMKAGLRDGDEEEIRATAHRLRPCFHYLGRHDMAELLEKIENLTGENTTPLLEELCRTFFSEAELFLNEVSELLSDYSA